MADAESNIRIDIDADAALATLKNLQRQISAFHQNLAASGNAANKQISENLQRNLISNINATGKFSASLESVKSTADNFTTSLEKNKFSLGEYFRYGVASTKSFGKVFRTEFEVIEKTARERVKTLQTQYIKMGRDANGAIQAIQVRPLMLDMERLATKTAIAAQKQQLLNQLLKQGSTNLLNFGKNTQWAGRQLMVGFTIPLSIFGTTAAKSFMEMEEAVIRFQRVYGDFGTSAAETENMVKQVKALANEFTKYGVAVSKTMGLAADVAAMGKSGAELTAQVAEATRLAVLGGVEQAQALETTISMTNAFGTAAEDLAGKIDFLNSVENQTVTSIEDLTIAIPKAGPVIKQLGGSVEDLAFFLTAMKEGGINASEGANALKSGIASMINPTGKASEFLNTLGINLKGIVEANKGDIKGTIVEFAQALDTLDPLNRARAIEQLFGKFQFARLSTLFQNVIAQGSQANRVLDLTRASAAELAVLSERELKRVESSPLYKFQKALEDIKASLVPLGEEFLKLITPIIEFGTNLMKQFNSLGDGAKQFVVGLVAVLGLIAPAAIMTFGLVANGVANLIKGFGAYRILLQKLSGATANAGGSTEYLTQEQLQSMAAAASLNQVHSNLVQTFTAEKSAVDALTQSYRMAISAQAAFGGYRGPAQGPAQKFKTGGFVSGPGTGTSDSIPAWLSNGEAVIPAKQVKQHRPLVESLISGNAPKYAKGGIVGIPEFKFGGIMNLPFMQKIMRKIKPGGAQHGFKEGFLRWLTGNRLKDYGPNAVGSFSFANDEYEQAAFTQLMRSNPEIGVRMPSSDFISALQRRDFQYKNMFQTGKSTVKDNKKSRMQVEENLFGIPQSAQPNERPVYGFVFKNELQDSILSKPGSKKPAGLMSSPSQAMSKLSDFPLFGNSARAGAKKYFNWQTANLQNSKLTQYGDVAMVLKPGVKKRSTFSLGDTLLSATRTTGSSSLKPAKFGTRSRKAIAGATSQKEQNYIEAQIMGGFSFDEIDRLIVNSPEMIPLLTQHLRNAGLNIPVGLPKQTFMQKLKSMVYGGRFKLNDPKMIPDPHTGAPGFSKGGIAGKPKASIFDLDDTLLDLASFMPGHRAANELLPKGQKKLWHVEAAKNPKGIEPVIARLKEAQKRGNTVILMTARPQAFDPVTIETLKNLGIDPSRIKLVSRTNADPRKAEEMKYNKTSDLMQSYNIEEFYDDMDATRGAIGLLGIPTFNPLKFFKGGIVKKYADGGLIKGPGTGTSDSIPAMVSNGEAIISAKRTKKYMPLIQSIIADNIPGYASPSGGSIIGAGGQSKKEIRLAERRKVATDINPEAAAEIDQIATEFGLNIEETRKLFSSFVSLLRKKNGEVKEDLDTLRADLEAGRASQQPKAQTVDQFRKKSGALKQITENFAHTGGKTTIKAKDMIRLQEEGKARFQSGMIDRAKQDPDAEAYLYSQQGLSGFDPKTNKQLATKSGATGEDFKTSIEKLPITTLDKSVDAVGGDVERLRAGLDEIVAILKQKAAELEVDRAFDSEADAQQYREQNPGAKAVSLENLVAETLTEAGQSDNEETRLAAAAYREAAITPGEAAFAGGSSNREGKRRGVKAFDSVQEMAVTAGDLGPKMEAGMDDSKAWKKGATQVLGDGESDPWKIATPERNSPHPETFGAGRDDFESYAQGANSSPQKLPWQKDNDFGSWGSSAEDDRFASMSVEEAELLDDNAAKQRKRDSRTGIGGKALNMLEDLTSGIREKAEKKIFDVLNVTGAPNRMSDGRIYESTTGKTFANDAEYEQYMAKKREAVDLELRAAKQQFNASNTQINASNIQNEAAQTQMQDASQDLAQVDGIPGQPQTRREIREAGKARDAEQKAQDKKDKKEARPGKRQARAGRLAGFAGTAMMAAGMASMMPGQIGEFAQSAMPFVSVLATLGPILLALPGPVALVVAAIGGLAFAFISVNNKFNEIKDAAKKMADTLSVGSEAMKRFADVSGKATAGEIRDKQREQEQALINIQAGKDTFGNQYLQSEGGQELLKTSESAIAKMGKADAAEDLANQLTMAVASGALDASQAVSIAGNIGSQLNDTEFSVRVIGQMAEILGPGGKNIKDEPLEVGVKLIGAIKEDVEFAFDDFQDTIDKYGSIDINPLEGQAVFDVTADQQAAKDKIRDQKLKKIQDEVDASGWGWTADWLTLGIGHLAQWNTAVAEAEFEVKAKEVEAFGLASRKAANAVSGLQEALDSVDIAYQRQIDAAREAGDAEKEELWLNKQREEKQELMDSYAEALDAIRQSFNELESETKKTQFLKDLDSSILEGLEGEMKIVTQDALDKINRALEDSTITSDMAYMLKIQLDAGNIDVDTINSILSMDNDGIQKSFDVIMTVGAKDAKNIFSISNLFLKENGEPDTAQKKKFIAQFSTMDANQVTDALSAWNSISASLGFMNENEVDAMADFFLNTEGAAQGLADTLGKIKDDDTLDWFAENKDTTQEVQIDYIQNLVGEDVAGIVGDNYDYFKSLDPVNKVLYLQVLATLAMPVMSGDMDQDVMKWALSSGTITASQAVKGNLDMNDLRSQFIAAQGWETTISNMLGDIDNAAGGGGGGGAASDPFASILDALKRVRDAAINAKGGIDELLRIAGKGKDLTIFNGMDQQLLSRGWNEEFRSFISGLELGSEEAAKFYKISKDGTLTLTATGKALKNAFDQKILGDFQLTQVKTVSDINNQRIAVEKLTGAGVDLADAYELVADAALAAAIANGKISADEWARLTEEIRKAKAALEEFNLEQYLAEQAEKASQDKAIFDWVKKAFGPEATREAMDAFLNAPDAIKSIIENIANATPEQIQQILDYWNSVKDQFNLDIEIDLVPPSQTPEEEFNEAYGNVQRWFAAKEAAIELKFQAKVANDEEIIRDAENAIAAIQYQIDDYEAGLREIEDQETKINEKYDDRFEALDKVQKANETIARQQKAQLTIADALSQGDIAAAAAAVIDMRAQYASDQAQEQRTLLEQAKENELAGIRNSLGLTREETEKRIKELQDEIFKIEEQQLEPAQERIRLATILKDEQIRSLEVLGKTKDEWALIQSGIELAIVDTIEFADKMQKALDIIEKIRNGTFSPEDLTKKPPLPDPNVGTGGGDTGTGGGDTGTTTPAAKKEYRAKAGEKVSDLAKRFGTTVEEILKLNPKFTDPNNANYKEGYKGGEYLYENTLVWIPGTATNLPSSSGTSSSGTTSSASSPNNNGSNKDDGDKVEVDYAALSEERANNELYDLSKYPKKDAGIGKKWVIGMGGTQWVATTVPVPGGMTNSYYWDTFTDTWRFKGVSVPSPSTSSPSYPQLTDPSSSSNPLPGYNPYGTGSGYRGYVAGGGGYAAGGLVSKSILPGFKLPSFGTDTVPAMLTPGEFVVRKYAVNKFGVDNLKAINSGATMGSSVYNSYDINVNVRTDANPDQIATAVMSRIRQIDSQRIRGNRF